MRPISLGPLGLALALPERALVEFARFRLHREDRGLVKESSVLLESARTQKRPVGVVTQTVG